MLAMKNSDWVVANAKIWTGRASSPWAAGMHIRDGVIVGMDGSTQMPVDADLQGAFVTPGLIDAHLHFLAGGESLQTLDLSDASSPEEFRNRVLREHESLAPDRWLIATGWSENRWDPPEAPDASWLSGCGDRPVVCWRMDLHSALINTVVMDQLELPDDETLLAEGGRVVRDAQGRPTGILQEAAAWQYLNPKIPKLPQHLRGKAIEVAADHCLSLGLTAVRTMEYKRDLLDLYLDHHCDSPRIRMSAVVLDRTLPLELDWIGQMPHNDWFRITGCKSFLDGTLGSRTARLSAPYADDSENLGSYTEHLLEGRLDDWVDEVVARGLSPVMHAIGDAAVKAAIDAVGDLSDDCRATIEHAEVMTPEIIEALSNRSSLRLSIQPLHRADDAVFAEMALGPERSGSLLPMAAVNRLGVRMAFGSDWPVVSVDPIAGMQAAITGRDVDGKPFHQEQAIGVEEALRSYTVRAAEMSGLDHVGVLEAGRRADFVVWDRDPFTVDWDVQRPSIMATIVDGKLAYGSLPSQEQSS